MKFDIIRKKDLMLSEVICQNFVKIISDALNKIQITNINIKLLIFYNNYVN